MTEKRDKTEIKTACVYNDGGPDIRDILKKSLIVFVNAMQTEPDTPVEGGAACER